MKKTAGILQVRGKLVKADYEHFVPEFERLVRKHGKLRVFFDMTGFHGWEAGALWEDIKFDSKHFADIERLAMVGENKWQRGMATFCKPFTAATIRYFDLDCIGITTARGIGRMSLLALPGRNERSRIRIEHYMGTNVQLRIRRHIVARESKVLLESSS